MAIHFNCTGCGKALFAQDQYAGRAVTCPGCQTSNTIPSNAAAPQPQALPRLLDMEAPRAGALDSDAPRSLEALKETAAAAPAVVAPASAPLETGPGGQAGSGQETSAAAPAPAAAEATKVCPLCAETIKAAARKCRFCGALLDETLRQEEDDRRKEQAMLSVLALAERSTNTWRSVAIICSVCTAAWLSYLTLSLLLAHDPPYLLIVFNVFLVFGLFRSIRQMRTGAYPVFLAAATAVLLCMPLNLQLGLLGEATLEKMLEQMQKNLAPDQPQPTVAQLKAVILLLFSVTGFIFSIPIWLAALKVAAFQRLKATFGGGKS